MIKLVLFPMLFILNRASVRRSGGGGGGGGGWSESLGSRSLGSGSWHTSPAVQTGESSLLTGSVDVNRLLLLAVSILKKT